MTLSAVVKTTVGLTSVAAPVMVVVGPGIPPIPEIYLAIAGTALSALGGAYASFTWGEPVEPRGMFWRMFSSCVIMGILLSFLVNAGVNHFMPTFELTVLTRCGIAGLVTCLTRFAMPRIIDATRTGDWRDFVPRLRRASRDAVPQRETPP